MVAPEAPTGSLAKPSAPTAVFPTEGDLAPLPSLPAPAEAFGDTVAVNRWSVKASAQTENAAYEDSSPWGEIARTAASAHSGAARLSPALRCAATEIARFYSEKGGLPTESLRRFLVARCGATEPDATPYIYGLTGLPAPSDSQLVARAADGVRQYLEKALAGETPRAFAIATSRFDERVSVAVVVAADPATLEPLARSVDAQRNVTIRGTVRAGAANAMALVNRGDYGFASCTPDPEAALPKFGFSCHLDDKDNYAWVQVLVRRANRVMDDSVADVLVYEGDPEHLEYRPHPLEKSAGGDADVRTALLAGVNRARAAAGLGLLSLAAAQSGTNARLAGTLIDASLKNRATDADRIALGMLAGWNVDGTIRNGGLFMGLVTPARDAGSWLDFAIERPVGRYVLFDPDARRIAIAPLQAQNGIGAVVTTYALFDSPKHDADADHVFRRLTATRSALGRAALAARPHVGALDEQSARVLAGAVEPGAALFTSMQSLAAQVSGARVHGYVVEANDLDRAPQPQDLLEANGGSLVVSVTHHRVKGAAWGQYVIFYLYVDAAAAPGVQL